MKIFCIFPCTNYEDKISTILKIFHQNIAPKLKSLGSTKTNYSFGPTNYEFVETDETSRGDGKGKGIIKSVHNLDEKPDVVICCDASGAIPYEKIIDIFTRLVSDSSIHCVMSNRIGNKSVTPIRYLIERFEIFAIQTLHEHDTKILDGQCGLQCYRYGKTNINNSEEEIKLTAQGYDIEIDLVDEVLSKKFKYSFVDIVLPPRDVLSSYNKEDSLKKMNFLLNKQNKLKDKLQEYINNFEDTEEFKELIDESIRKEWDEYKEDILKI